MLRRRDLIVTLVALPAGALAGEAELEHAVRAAIGTRAIADGGIEITAPRLAENGAQVPITVHVPSAMTETDHVMAIHLFATANPTPGIASFRFRPGIARAEVTTRIRLAQAQRVLVLAELSDGRVRRAAAEIGVTTGGCLT
ncbi:thiosulfate oxidation carrier protein SoxY [Elioraea sp.]|uniref:thiosulfate oxidation carrier protein SoxY n=1 Tax=Elioraea sp. TaxID=2185103 RepID=UPI00307E880A